MKTFFRGGAFKILLAVIVVFIGIMIGTAAGGRQANIPSSVVNTIASPFQSITAMFHNGIGGIGKYFGDQQTLLKENQQLKDEITTLRSSLADYQMTKQQNDQYKAMLGITEQRPDIKMVDALVTATSSIEYFNQFTINKGSLSGVKLKDPVVTSEGIVGFVTEVGLDYANVTTLFSPDANVGAYDVTTQDFGIISGTAQLADKGLFRLAYLPQDSQVSTGNIITTSGLGSTFPPGLVIGIVKEADKSAQGVSFEAVLTPSADFSRLRSVMVITSFKAGKVTAPASSSVTSGSSITSSVSSGAKKP